jgi:hypothetical protein
MTTFDTWLRELARAGKGPLPLKGATRGLKWERPVELEGDWTGATLTAKVRQYPDAAAVLATCTVSGPVVAAGVSTWMVSLAAGSGANSTGVLPADADLDGVEYFAFAIHLAPSGGDEDLLLGGALPVIGRVA